MSISLNLETNDFGQAILTTTRIHEVTASFSRKTRSIKNKATISLRFYPSLELVTDKPFKRTLESIFDSNSRFNDNGISIIDDHTATFKVKINVLSSQCGQTQFCFCVSTGDVSIYSLPFKTITKTHRRKRNSSTNEDYDFDLNWFLTECENQDLEIQPEPKRCCRHCEAIDAKLNRILELLEPKRNDDETGQIDSSSGDINEIKCIEC